MRALFGVQKEPVGRSYISNEFDVLSSIFHRRAFGSLDFYVVVIPDET